MHARHAQHLWCEQQQQQHRSRNTNAKLAQISSYSKTVNQLTLYAKRHATLLQHKMRVDDAIDAMSIWNICRYTTLHFSLTTNCFLRPVSCAHNHNELISKPNTHKHLSTRQCTVKAAKSPLVLTRERSPSSGQQQQHAQNRTESSDSHDNEHGFTDRPTDQSDQPTDRPTERTNERLTVWLSSDD